MRIILFRQVAKTIASVYRYMTYCIHPLHHGMQYCESWGYLLIGIAAASPCFLLPVFLQSKVRTDIPWPHCIFMATLYFHKNNCNFVNCLGWSTEAMASEILGQGGIQELDRWGCSVIGLNNHLPNAISGTPRQTFGSLSLDMLATTFGHITSSNFWEHPTQWSHTDWMRFVLCHIGLKSDSCWS